MAVSTGVVAIIRLDVAEVRVSMPEWKKIIYNEKPRPPDSKNKGMCRGFFGPCIRLIRPIISRMTAARLQRSRPSTFGVKAAAANFVIGKADDHRKTVVNAKSADFAVFFIMRLPPVMTRQIISNFTGKVEILQRDCGIL